MYLRFKFYRQSKTSVSAEMKDLSQSPTDLQRVRMAYESCSYLWWWFSFGNNTAELGISAFHYLE